MTFSKMFALGLVLAKAVAEDAIPATTDVATGLSGDDECLGDEQCALNALQLRGAEFEDVDDFEELVDDDVDWLSVPDGYLAARCRGRSYCVMGRPHPYMVVAGRHGAVGMESINGGNMGYYNSLMSAAWSHCGGSSCVIMTNPRGFRTQSRFHIHFRHQNGHGRSLKAKMEKKVCGGGGWQKGGFPCGGKAKFFHGHPGVMSAASGAGGLGGAGVSVWPQACGGGGAIILVTYHCSIEHSVAVIPPKHR
eukprot:TRINITY_DN5465_c0_g2_i2.p1 TRINITY_DN5465_c0_g2~~TRINITY_DN5465_c0_g2_i2.p1  ORF type:complete len:275 (+),score=54.23 TRINITY_DN5465_c0_g2_i2:78-827(+)